MAKQKFCCKGVLRTTGQKVMITVAADNKETAVKIANQHDVTVESVMPVAEGAAEPPKPAGNRAPAPPKPAANPTPAAPKLAAKDIDARLDEILDAEEADGGLDDFDLDDDAKSAAAAPDPLATKSCPYCGEQILAVAVKCKHCGERLPSGISRGGQSAPVPPSSKSDAAGVISLICGIMAFFVFVVGCLLFNFYAYVTYPITFLFAVGGLVSGIFARGNLRVAGVFLNILAAIPGVVAFVMLLITLATTVRSASEQVSNIVTTPLPTAPADAPTPPPRVKTPAPSPEEMAFAAKMVAFLDGCDEMISLLEKGAKSEQLNKQTELLKSLQAAIPPPPQGASWAETTAKSSKELLGVLTLVTARGAEQDLVGDLLKQTAGATIDNRDAYRQLAEQIRKLVAPIRAQIPAACLPKPKG